MENRIDLLQGARREIDRRHLTGLVVYLDSRPFINRVGIKDASQGAESAVYRYLLRYTGKITVFDRY